MINDLARLRGLRRFGTLRSSPERDLSVTAWLRKLRANSKQPGRTFPFYCSFAYSALACFRMGMSGSASFQRVKNSWYALRALAVSP
jgi:hypothetical protein